MRRLHARPVGSRRERNAPAPAGQPRSHRLPLGRRPGQRDGAEGDRSAAHQRGRPEHSRSVHAPNARREAAHQWSIPAMRPDAPRLREPVGRQGRSAYGRGNAGRCLALNEGWGPSRIFKTGERGRRKRWARRRCGRPRRRRHRLYGPDLDPGPAPPPDVRGHDRNRAPETVGYLALGRRIRERPALRRPAVAGVDVAVGV
jgi:hypothetical protein